MLRMRNPRQLVASIGLVVLRMLDLNQTDAHGKLIVISFFAFVFVCFDHIHEVLFPLDPTSPGHSSPCFMDALMDQHALYGNFYLLLNMLTNTMTALSRLLSGDRDAPINLRSEMTDTMTDLSRLLSEDRHDQLICNQKRLIL